MPAYHTVLQGEHLTAIAEQYGFSDYRTIWEHPENAELRRLRTDPHVLLPGDRLYVPDKERKKELAETSRRNRFRLLRNKLMLRIVVRDPDERPIGSTACILEVQGREYSLTTDAEGLIQQEISASASEGKLTIRDMEVPIRIGHLDPVEARSGQQARLNNLGYYAGEVGAEDEEMLRSATEEFQCDQGLTVSGECDEQTQARLREIHGC